MDVLPRMALFRVSTSTLGRRHGCTGSLIPYVVEGLKAWWRGGLGFVRRVPHGENWVCILLTTNVSDKCLFKEREVIQGVLRVSN